MEIKIIKFKDDVQLPKRQHYNDAGADVYCPYDLTILPGETETVPLGFGLELPDGLMGTIYPRSSMAAAGLITGMPPIDSGYRGEIYAIITNTESFPITADKGTRIGQLVISPVVIAEFVGSHDKERGTGAFGSTGK